jgi:hypothetical protein
MARVVEQVAAVCIAGIITMLSGPGCKARSCRASRLSKQSSRSLLIASSGPRHFLMPARPSNLAA